MAKKDDIDAKGKIRGNKKERSGFKINNLIVWKNLYESAVEFREASPWSHLREIDLFGIENPYTGEIGYCQITGLLGQHKALSVYRGNEGLHFILDLLMRKRPMDWHSVLLDCSKLEASFEDKSLLEPVDLEIIDKLGLKFRGKMTWPMFRDFRPAYVPWIVSEEDVVFLTHALKLTGNLIENVFKRGKALQNPIESNKIVIFSLKKAGNDIKLEARTQDVPPHIEPSFPQVSLDEVRVKRIAKKIKMRSGSWEVGGVFSRVPVADAKSGRPYFPAILLWLETLTEEILNQRLVRKEEINANILDATLETIEETGQIPSQITVSLKKTYDLLKPLTEKLNVRLNLAASSEFYQNISSFLASTLEQPEIIDNMTKKS